MSVSDWDEFRRFFVLFANVLEISLLIALVAAMSRLWTIIRSLIDMGMALQRYEDLARQGKLGQDVPPVWRSDWSRQGGGRDEGSPQR